MDFVTKSWGLTLFYALLTTSEDNALHAGCTHALDVPMSSRKINTILHFTADTVFSSQHHLHVRKDIYYISTCLAATHNTKSSAREVEETNLWTQRNQNRVRFTSKNDRKAGEYSSPELTILEHTETLCRKGYGWNILATLTKEKGNKERIIRLKINYINNYLARRSVIFANLLVYYINWSTYIWRVIV